MTESANFGADSTILEFLGLTYDGTAPQNSDTGSSLETFSTFSANRELNTPPPQDDNNYLTPYEKAPVIKNTDLIDDVLDNLDWLFYDGNQNLNTDGSNQSSIVVPENVSTNVPCHANSEHSGPNNPTVDLHRSSSNELMTSTETSPQCMGQLFETVPGIKKTDATNNLQYLSVDVDPKNSNTDGINQISNVVPQNVSGTVPCHANSEHMEPRYVVIQNIPHFSPGKDMKSAEISHQSTSMPIVPSKMNNFSTNMIMVIPESSYQYTNIPEASSLDSRKNEELNKSKISLKKLKRYAEDPTDDSDKATKRKNAKRSYERRVEVKRLKKESEEKVRDLEERCERLEKENWSLKCKLDAYDHFRSSKNL